MTRHHLVAAALAAIISAGCGPEHSADPLSGPPELEAALGSSAQASDIDTGTAPGGEPSTAASAAASAEQGATSTLMEDKALNGTSVEAYAPILYGCDLTASVRGTPLPTGCSNNGPLRSSPLAWAFLAGVTLEDGSPVSSVALDGTRFTGLVNGAPIGGKDFEKARFIGLATSGATVQLRLEHAEPGHSKQEAVWRYEVRYLTAKGDWKNLCTGGKDAVVVSGRWDPHQGVIGDGAKVADPTVFTIGCRRSAIEKCVNGGYWPWETRNGSSLDPYHQACVRMLRADYCGDGVSHTAPGRKVNLYDGLGIQRDDEHWVTEAEWTPAGASCLNTLNLLPVDAPCLGTLGTPTCGQTSSFAGGALIISETPHAGGRDGKLATGE